MPKYLQAILIFFCIAIMATADTAPIPEIKTISTDDLPQTTITLPWNEPSKPLPDTDANPAEKIVIYLRGAAGKYITNADKSIFAINLKWVTHTSLVYIIQRDKHGYLHLFSINKQLVSLFPKSYDFPDTGDITANRIQDHILHLSSYRDTGHYWCDFDVEVNPSGNLRLIKYHTDHDEYYRQN
jgi:hypothetical protein